MTPEGTLKAAVVEYLNRAGYHYIRPNPGRVKIKRGWLHGAKEGTADFLIFKGPLIYWAELKAPGQKTSKDRTEKQQAFREQVLAEGHHHKRCESVDDLIALLESK